jgi:hypothetical protein
MTKKVSLLVGGVVIVLIVLVGWYLKSRPYNTSIKSINQAEVGQLVVLTADGGSAYQWLVLPTTTNIKVIEEGRSLVFSATKEGTYTFICAMTKNGKVKLLVHTLVVGKGSPVDPEDTTSFSSTVKSWLPAGYSKEAALKLAHSLELAATSRQEDVASLIKITSISNRAALGEDIKAWEPFLKSFSEYCKNNLKDKPLEDHINVWLSVAAALKG